MRGLKCRGKRPRQEKKNTRCTKIGRGRREWRRKASIVARYLPASGRRRRARIRLSAPHFAPGAGSCRAPLIGHGHAVECNFPTAEVNFRAGGALNASLWPQPRFPWRWSIKGFRVNLAFCGGAPWRHAACQAWQTRARSRTKFPVRAYAGHRLIPAKPKDPTTVRRRSLNAQVSGVTGATEDFFCLSGRCCLLCPVTRC